MITASDKLTCVEREVKMRRQVYQRRVTNGVMRQETADREIEIMEAIAEDYRILVTKERLL